MDHGSVKLEGLDTMVTIVGRDVNVAMRLLRDAVADIADAVERESVALAPMGDDEAGWYPGKTPLKDHPVDRSDIVGQASSANPLFGGGFALRGPGGRFIPGVGEEGQVVATSVITVARFPRHAIWVHEGTGIYGPVGSPIVPRRAPNMIFMWKGRLRVTPVVLGQESQPFLREAYWWVDRTYVPLRVEQLRARIALST